MWSIIAAYVGIGLWLAVLACWFAWARARPASQKVRLYPVFALLLATGAGVFGRATGLPYVVLVPLLLLLGLFEIGTIRFCRACGASVRNPIWKFTNWPNCPSCQAEVASVGVLRPWPFQRSEGRASSKAP